MNDSKIDDLKKLCDKLKIETETGVIAEWVLRNSMDEKAQEIVASFLSLHAEYKHALLVERLIKGSRLPQKDLKTFENYSLRQLPETAIEKIRCLATLSFIEAKKNVIFIGPSGTGKTHLAQAIGNKCVRSGRPAYFITASELKGKMHKAIVTGSVATFMNIMTRYTCLIIDEVGQTEKFDRAETHLFFSMVDRIYSRTKNVIIITSNVEGSEWADCFDDDQAVECTLDRLFDKAIAVQLSGTSYRGQERENVYLELDSPIQIDLD